MTSAGFEDDVASQGLGNEDATLPETCTLGFLLGEDGADVSVHLLDAVDAAQHSPEADVSKPRGIPSHLLGESNTLPESAWHE